MLIIPNEKLTLTADIPPTADYGGLKLLRLQSDEAARTKYLASRFVCQHEFEKYNVVKATLTRKGVVHKYRICATLHVQLGKFVEIVKYDPANPPAADYQAQGMRQAHERTQS